MLKKFRSQVWGQRFRQLNCSMLENGRNLGFASEKTTEEEKEDLLNDMESVWIWSCEGDQWIFKNKNRNISCLSCLYCSNINLFIYSNLYNFATSQKPCKCFCMFSICMEQVWNRDGHEKWLEDPGLNDSSI